MFLVQQHDLLLLALHVRLVLRLNRLHLRLQRLQLELRSHRGLVERPEHYPNRDTEHDQYPAVAQIERIVHP